MPDRTCVTRTHVISGKTRGVSSAEQDRQASTDAGDDERHDEDACDELGVHHECASRMQLSSLFDETSSVILVPSLALPRQTVLSPCSTWSA